MKLYNPIIQGTEELLRPLRPKVWAYDAAAAWEDVGESELVLMRDAAYELGGSDMPAVNYTCVTTDSRLIDENQVLLYGPDLKDIHGDCAYARIVLLRVADIEGDGEDGDEEAYKAIRDMEFVKYHVFPKGYMFRISSGDFREQVRVGKKAIRSGISFRTVGFDFIKQYLKNPNILRAKIIFVTAPEAPYKTFLDNAQKVSEITKTLTHILDGIPMDCGFCQLKPICDEVEGMKELHFGKGAKPQA